MLVPRGPFRRLAGTGRLRQANHDSQQHRADARNAARPCEASEASAGKRPPDFSAPRRAASTKPVQACGMAHLETDDRAGHENWNLEMFRPRPPSSSACTVDCGDDAIQPTSAPFVNTFITMLCFFVMYHTSARSMPLQSCWNSRAMLTMHHPRPWRAACHQAQTS